MDLLLATGNQKKLAELEIILANFPVKLHTLKSFPNISEVEETGKTFEENAILKAQGYAAQTQMLTLAEDSGICVDALEGAPGVYSARFAGPDKDDDANNQKILRLLQKVPDNCRGAYYACVIALASPKKLIGTVRGEVRGGISHSLKGDGGFGYDPLFYYPPYQKTFGEVSAEMKHRVSHRAQALNRFKEMFEGYLAKT